MQRPQTLHGAVSFMRSIFLPPLFLIKVSAYIISWIFAIKEKPETTHLRNFRIS